jgi:protease I
MRIFRDMPCSNTAGHYQWTSLAAISSCLKERCDIEQGILHVARTFAHRINHLIMARRSGHQTIHTFQFQEKIMAQTNDEQSLGGLNIAILVTDGFEQVELTGPREALENVGATTRIVSSRHGTVQGFNHDAKADQFDVDLTFDEAASENFDAVLLPAGAFNADQIRAIPEAQHIVQRMHEDGKPIAAICHGAWLLVSAGLVEGKTVTSWPTLQDDIRNAGGKWVDQQVAVDGNLVSSRKPDDIPAFNQAFIELLMQRVNASLHGTQDQQTGIGLSG